MSVIPVIGPAIELVNKLIRKKPFVLWYHDLRTEKWVMKSDPMSKRQCRKTRTDLVSTGGYLADRFAILRKGVTP